ncbi:flagellin, partial [Acidithiobacillus sp.]|uniref:flagellin n=1 Tax=Acidithiobacillus sp. TaxID=1872118 RepID=UPI00261436D8
GSSVSSVNVSSAAGAQQAIGIMDQAINYLNQQNGALGAIQNRIQASVANDQTTATNLQSAQSVVQDANIAQATSQMTKYQILQQAGISTLAQENSLQQSFLKLIP